MKSLIVINNSTKEINLADNVEVVDLLQLRDEILNFNIFKRFLSYSEVTLQTFQMDFLLRPFACALLMRLMSRGSAWIEDDSGSKVKVNINLLFKLFVRLLKDAISLNKVISSVEKDISFIKSTSQNLNKQDYAQLDKGDVFYLRTDFVMGIKSGGSVGHIAGVANSLNNNGHNVHFFTTGVIPTVEPEVKQNIILPQCRFFDFKEVPYLAFSRYFANHAIDICNDTKPSLIYQRYSIDNFSGVILAQKYNVPFVLEYNGSEVWIAKNWGNPLKYQELAEGIEMLNLNAADMIVVVSKPMKDELTGRGIEPNKILVNPNCIDPCKYSPDVSGDVIRKRYGLEDKLVIGFIGTFGPWHGAEVLAKAALSLLSEIEELNLHFLFIGDGMRMPATKDIIEQGGASSFCTFTGLVPQEDGPKCLAACDILASPHVPNPDGSPFFGSPTKLFEYMGMGKPIVASVLEQIGEVLEHENTALMVEPGNVDQLVESILRLAKDEKLRDKLGRNARDEVVSRYTWDKNVDNVINALKALNSN